MSHDNDHYTPINCDMHSQYELAIMHHTPLRLAWRDHAGLDHVCTVLPIDLQTEYGEEYLLAQDHTGQAIRIRLDRIVTAHPLTHE